MAVLAAASLSSTSRLLSCVLHLQLHLQHGLSSARAGPRACRGGCTPGTGGCGDEPSCSSCWHSRGATWPFHCSTAHAGLSPLLTQPLPTMDTARQEPLQGFTKTGMAREDGAPWWFPPGLGEGHFQLWAKGLLALEAWRWW